MEREAVGRQGLVPEVEMTDDDREAMKERRSRRKKENGEHMTEKQHRQGRDLTAFRPESPAHVARQRMDG